MISLRKRTTTKKKKWSTACCDFNSRLDPSGTLEISPNQIPVNSDRVSPSEMKGKARSGFGSHIYRKTRKKKCSNPTKRALSLSRFDDSGQRTPFLAARKMKGGEKRERERGRKGKRDSKLVAQREWKLEYIVRVIWVLTVEWKSYEILSAAQKQEINAVLEEVSSGTRGIPIVGHLSPLVGRWMRNEELRTCRWMRMDKNRGSFNGHGTVAKKTDGFSSRHPTTKH